MAHHVRVREDGRIEGDLDHVVGLLCQARNPVALTGAGISVESGIPDFRSPGGLWTVFDPMEYATLSCFLKDPEKAWRLFRAIGKTVAGKEPNAAHRALAELERAGRLAGVITQNIDGLHQAAGSRTVLEIHGDGSRLHCIRCGWHEPLLRRHLEPGPFPRCPHCDHALKPTVVLFEEPVRDMGAIDGHLRRSDLLLVIGTSAQVTPSSLFPEEVQSRGGHVLEFNLEPTLLTPSLSPRGALVEGPASLTLHLVAERVLSSGRAEEAR